MKKISLHILAISLSLTFLPIQSSGKTYTSSFLGSKPIEADEVKILLQRLSEINAVDKSTLKRSDKKKLRTEVISIQHRLVGPGGGIYISVGAILLILLLLIILL